MIIADHEIPEAVWKRRAIVSRSLYQLRRKRGWSPQEAAMTPRSENKATRPPGLASMCEAAGLHHQAASDFKRRRPEKAATMSDEEIIDHLVAKRDAATLAERARMAGISPKTVSSRIGKLGWSLERALSTPVHKPGSTIYQNRSRHAQPD